MNQKLILASASPQRKTLLEGLGLPFDVIPSTLDEGVHPEWDDPARRARLLAELKAKEVALAHPRDWVIGCDTLVESPDGVIFEKPRDEREARAMVAAQSGRTSVVHSGLFVITPEGAHVEGVSSSRVRFKQLTEGELDWWIRTNQWQGRSGSFQIDGLGQLMIEEITGDWTGVVGLPVFLLGELLREAGYPLHV
ncbi:MAG: Maf family protein [Candidatus Peribacteraceae bacterium]|jgi:septum formation protein